MAFENIENLASPSTSTKRSGKRKRKGFVLKSRNRFDPPLFIPRTKLPRRYRSSAYAEISDPHRTEAREDNPIMKATTARNNDGMSFIW